MSSSKEIKYGFRMVHIDNIPYIKESGFVIHSSPIAYKDYKPIGDNGIIEKRKEKIINKTPLNQYIPFYFGPRTPMLYVIQNGLNGVQQQDAESIVYCVIKIEDIIKDNDIQCLFSDGHALDNLTEFYTKEYLCEVNQKINYNDVYAHYWINESDRDLKRRKEAELLIKDKLDRKHICGYVVYNENAKLKLINFGINDKKIEIKPNYYF